MSYYRLKTEIEISCEVCYTRVCVPAVLEIQREIDTVPGEVCRVEWDYPAGWKRGSWGEYQRCPGCV